MCRDHRRQSQRTVRASPATQGTKVKRTVAPEVGQQNASSQCWRPLTKHKKGARSAPCAWISEGFIFQMQQEQAQRAPVFLFSVLLLHSAMACCKTKPPASLEDRGCCTCKSLAMTYFHTGIRTIIGAKSFHCPVRDGKEWGQLAMVTRHKL